MRNTIYATFNDPKLAEKAASALLDHGLRTKDLSVIQSHKWRHFTGEKPALAVSERLLSISLVALFIPGLGLVVGEGALSTAIVGIASSESVGAAVAVMADYLRNQGIESDTVAVYETTINRGGAVLGATLPSGNVDESCAWDVLNRYAGLHVTSYENRPYLS